jgi:hypothetical protein
MDSIAAVVKFSAVQAGRPANPFRNNKPSKSRAKGSLVFTVWPEWNIFSCGPRPTVGTRQSRRDGVWGEVEQFCESPTITARLERIHRFHSDKCEHPDTSVHRTVRAQFLNFRSVRCRCCMRENKAVRRRVDLNGRSLGERPRENLIRQRVLQPLLNHPLERPRSVHGVVALRGE